MAAKKRRETESVLMTRAYREKLANKQPNTNYMFAVVRVRLPEGLLLQASRLQRMSCHTTIESLLEAQWCTWLSSQPT